MKKIICSFLLFADVMCLAMGHNEQQVNKDPSTLRMRVDVNGKFGGKGWNESSSYSEAVIDFLVNNNIIIKKQQSGRNTYEVSQEIAKDNFETLAEFVEDCKVENLSPATWMDGKRHRMGGYAYKLSFAVAAFPSTAFHDLKEVLNEPALSDAAVSYHRDMVDAGRNLPPLTNK